MDFKSEMDKKINLVDNRLRTLLKSRYPEIIYEAMGYSVFAGGKRLRPLLVLASYEAFTDIQSEAVLDFACALEMIHVYSLIHDDLPAMDDDDFRRGKPTCHKVYGEGMAILAGDGLLSLAFEVMAKNAAKEPKCACAMAEVAACAGVGGMLGGQVADIECESKEADGTDLEEALLYIHKNKTAALIKAAIISGAILAGADEKILEALRDAAVKLGLAFQIRDDILDVTSSSESLGKPVGSDEKNKKLTFVSLYGLEKAKDHYAEISQDTMSFFSGVVKDSSGGKFLIELVGDIIDRNK